MRTFRSQGQKSSTSASGLVDPRNAEGAIRLLASIVESSDDAILSNDMQGLITSWNEGATRMFGYTSEEAIGQPISILATPDRMDEPPTLLHRIRRGERIKPLETVRKAKDGRLVNVSLTTSPIFDATGNIIGASKVAHDITDQVRVRQELAEQREHLRVMLRSIGEGVIATDHAGVVTYLNSNAEDLTGWRQSTAIGKPLHQVFRLISEESRHRLRNPADAVLQHGRALGPENHMILIGKDGRERMIESSAAPIRNDRGKIAGVVVIFRDVTERRAKRKLEQQTDELRRVNEELSRFAFVVSHDLREPLRNISVFSELLANDCKDRPFCQRAVKNITDSVHRMSALLQDLLDYSHIRAAEHPPAGIVDTNEILHTSLMNLQSMTQETGAEIIGGHLPPVPGYETQLLQLFQNLISNAMKYRSDAPPVIRIQATRHGNEWIFSVRDNGIGIDAKHHESIFGAFKRLHSKNIPGTGLGLSICSKVVENHGGKIWVESHRGKGSEFFFTLPVSL